MNSNKSRRSSIAIPDGASMYKNYFYYTSCVSFANAVNQPSALTP
jgi:hypothetical protein